MGEPGTLEFAKSYAEAERADVRAPVGKTFDALLKAYQLSPEYRSLAASTKRCYSRYIDLISSRYGKVALQAFSHKGIRGELLAWRDSMALNTPSQAENIIRFMKVALSFGSDRGLIDINHLAGAKRFKGADHSGKIWSAKQIERILEVSPDYLQHAIKLALLTGQRISDLIRMRWDDIKGGFLSFRQQKTKAFVELPIFGALSVLLESIPRKAETILTNAFGASWSATKGLSDSWRSALGRAGFRELGLRFHDLRGTAITCLADMGCSEIEIAAFTGHSLEHVSKILKAYLGRTRAQAANAVAKLEASWIGQIAN